MIMIRATIAYAVHATRVILTEAGAIVVAADTKDLVYGQVSSKESIPDST